MTTSSQPVYLACERTFVHIGAARCVEQNTCEYVCRAAKAHNHRMAYK